jgi:hypothetical protein
VGEDDADIAQSFTRAGLRLCDDGTTASRICLDGVVLDGSWSGKVQGLEAANQVAVQSCLLVAK